MYPASCQPYPIRSPPSPSVSTSNRPNTTPPVSPPSPPLPSPSSSTKLPPSTRLLSWLDAAQPSTPPPSCGDTPSIRSPSLIGVTAGSSSTRFKIDLRLYAKIQKLRRVPWESSPLSFPARIVEWDEAECAEDEGMDGVAIDTSGEESVLEQGENHTAVSSWKQAYRSESGDGERMETEGEISRAVSSQPGGPQAGPSISISPNQSPLLGTGSSIVTVRSPPDPPFTDVSLGGPVGLGFRAEEDFSVRPGSSRTKLIIRRPPFNWSRTLSYPSSSNPLSPPHLDADAEGEPESPNIPLPDPHRIAIRLRRRAERESPRGRGKMIIGGRLKVYDDTDPRLTAILRAWEQGLGTRWDPAEAYRIMGKPVPTLEAAPPGFDQPGSKEPGLGLSLDKDIEMKPFLSPPRRKTTKRLRISPEIKKDRLLSSPEIRLSGGFRKKGRIGKGLESVPLTRISTPILTLQDDDDDMPDSSCEAEEEQLNEISTPSNDGSLISYPSVLEPSIAIPQLYVPKVYSSDTPEDQVMDMDKDDNLTPPNVTPFTGRQIFPSAPDPAEPRLSLSLSQTPQSKFSPPTPEAQDDFQGWQVLHLEHSANSGKYRPSRAMTTLGLDLGGELQPSESGPGDTTPRPRPDVSAPTEQKDVSDDPYGIAERNRQFLCAAIEELAREHARLTLPDWTPPERKEPDIDDTPSTVIDEIITTPDNDFTQLPSVQTPVTPSIVQTTENDEEEEEEAPRPRLNKGKGRARPEDELMVSIPSVPMERDRPQYHERQKQVASSYYQPYGGERRRMTYDQVQAKLENYVLEVSALEARQADTEVEGGGSPTTAGSIASRIQHINRKIQRLSKEYGLAGESAPTSQSLVAVIESDEQLAIRLQMQYEEEERAHHQQSQRVENAIMKRPGIGTAIPGGVSMERSKVEPVPLAEPWPVQQVDTVDAWAPKLAGRQLTFGMGEEGGKSEGKKRASVMELLDRKALFDNKSESQSGSASPRFTSPTRPLWSDTVRSRPTSSVLALPSGSTTPQINLIPPTPMIRLRPTQGWSGIDVAHPSHLDDPLQMSYLDLSDDEEDFSGVEGVELEADDFEMDFEDIVSDSDSDDETVSAGRSPTSTLVGSPPGRGGINLGSGFRTPSPPPREAAATRSSHGIRDDEDEDAEQWIEDVEVGLR